MPTESELRHNPGLDPLPDVGALKAALASLATAEQFYRKSHDLHGGGSREAGRAWDLMRRAGDHARAILNPSS